MRKPFGVEDARIFLLGAEELVKYNNGFLQRGEVDTAKIIVCVDALKRGTDEASLECLKRAFDASGVKVKNPQHLGNLRNKMLKELGIPGQATKQTRDAVALLLRSLHEVMTPAPEAPRGAPPVHAAL